jgi:hypothetical protein
VEHTNDQADNRHWPEELHSKLNSLEHDNSIEPSCYEDVFCRHEKHWKNPPPAKRRHQMEAVWHTYNLDTWCIAIIGKEKIFNDRGIIL